MDIKLKCNIKSQKKKIKTKGKENLELLGSTSEQVSKNQYWENVHQSN